MEGVGEAIISPDFFLTITGKSKSAEKWILEPDVEALQRGVGARGRGHPFEVEFQPGKEMQTF
jgi:hypothetical protein